MSVWIIEPRDPLIVRDARPFSAAVAGARATSLDFPFPSTVAGGARTRAGLSEGVFDKSLIPEVKGIEIRGPLLVELDRRGEVSDWLFPAPSDAMLLARAEGGCSAAGDHAGVTLVRLFPLDFGPGLTNLGDVAAELLPVGAGSPLKGKPYSGAPRYWRLGALANWLTQDRLGGDTSGVSVTPSELGHDGPLKETRTHVGVERGTQTAREGALFQTSGLVFRRPSAEGGPGVPVRLGLAVWVDDSGRGGQIADGPAPLAGERRLVEWRRSADDLPACPPEVRERVVADRACRVMLLTPAHFDEGSTPRWLVEPRGGVRPRLRAMASGRAQVVSGWDFEFDRPKPTRRLVPAGATFFLTLEGGDAEIGKWVDDMWMRCVSDGEADRRDGFGMAAVGVWNGRPLTLE
jgi:CRISPR-associated protein Cmr3